MAEKKPSSFARNRELALQLFASQGFGQVSLRKLASHLGLSTAALYSHCSSKEELLFEALEEHYENILSIVSRSTRHRTCRKQALRQIAAAMLELHRCTPWHFLLASRERHCLCSEHLQQIEQLRLRISVQLQQLAGQGAREQRLDSPVVNHLALHLLEQLPVWLSAANLSAECQTALIEDLIQGLWCQLSERRQAPAMTEEPRYAPVQRRSA